MAKLKNFTLEGEALRLIAYEDHHGVKHYDLELLPEYNEKALTGDRLLKFAKAISCDVEKWGGVINRCAGEFTNKTLFEFFDEVKDDQQEVGT